MDIRALKEPLLEMRNIGSIQALLQWDQETYMPEGSGNIRAEHISYLSTLGHNIHTDHRSNE